MAHETTERVTSNQQARVDAHTPQRTDAEAQRDPNRPPSRRRVILNRVLLETRPSDDLSIYYSAL